MNPIITEFLKLFAREVASEVVKHITKEKPAAAAEAVAPAAGSKTTADLFKPEITADRSENEWRADCLAIINLLAPTHGRQLRALLAKFDGAKRLGDIKADALPALLAELAALKDA